MNCKECNTEFSTDNKNKKFCGTSCQNRYNVREWKRAQRNKKKELQEGYNERSWVVMNMTVHEYTGGKGISKFKNSVRGFAKNWHPELKELPCYICGYAKHVEYAHIKPLTSFTHDALLKDINARTNLVQLCPNCHWEYDSGLIDLSPYSSDV